MARFTALQRVRLKRNIYQGCANSATREAFTPGRTGFISRVSPGNQHFQHDDNYVYWIMLDCGHDQGSQGYRMDPEGWLVQGYELEDIDEQARLEAVAAEMRQISDEYWNVGQATAHPAVATPVRSVSNYQGVQITGTWLDEQWDELSRYIRT